MKKPIYSSRKIMEHNLKKNQLPDAKKKVEALAKSPEIHKSLTKSRFTVGIGKEANDTLKSKLNMPL